MPSGGAYHSWSKQDWTGSCVKGPKAEESVARPVQKRADAFASTLFDFDADFTNGAPVVGTATYLNWNKRARATKPARAAQD
jgi:hypothetical protein